MTLSQIFSKLNILNAEVTIFRNTTSWTGDDERWGCVFTLSHNGTELKVKSVAPSGDEAILKSFDKLEAMLKSETLVSELRVPLLASA